MQQDNRKGCLEGLLQIGVLSALFGWSQKKFGFGRGASCTGCAFGIILLIVFLILLCNILGGTDWFSLTSAVP